MSRDFESQRYEHARAAKPPKTDLDAASGIRSEQEQQPAPPQPPVPTHTLPTGWRLAILVLTTCLAMFLAALDLTIVAVAIPTITAEFNSTTQVGWYGSAYFLMMCVFQLVWGRLYTLFNMKWTYITAIAIFEVGSIVAATAPTSEALIVGRAIQGLGGGGIVSGSNTIIAFSTTLEKRPLYSSILGSVYGISSVVGPLLGGVLVSKLVWRWVFYINLPFGALAALGVIFVFKAPPIADQASKNLSLKEKAKKLDPIGTLLFVGSLTCLFIALEWGGSQYSWRSGQIIALLVIFGIGFASWLVLQWWKKDAALVPARIVKQRSMSFALFFNFTTGGAFFLLLYYLAIWFQAVKGVTPIQAGVDQIPMILGNTIGNMVTAWIVTKLGYFAPFPILSSILTSIGCGLLTTLTYTSDSPYWIGYQVIVGIGVGVGWQQGLLVAQTMFAKKDIPVAVALTSALKLFGGAVFESVGVNVFANLLLKNLGEDAPHVHAYDVLWGGASELSKIVPKGALEHVYQAYSDSLTQTFYVCTALSALSMIGALGFEWKSVKKPKKPAGPPQPSAEPPSEQTSAPESDTDMSCSSSLNEKDSKDALDIMKFDFRPSTPLGSSIDRELSSLSWRMPEIAQADNRLIYLPGILGDCRYSAQ